MKITIQRIEIVMITRKKIILNTHDFTNWSDAFEYLEKQLNLVLSDDHREAFKANEYTVTNSHKEMVNAGNVAYLADVVYAVEVTE